MYVGLFERETYPWLRKLSRNAKTAIDIGAAHGEYTIYFLKKTEAVTVLSFEPEESLMDSLKENLRLNGEEASKRLALSTSFVGRENTGTHVCLDSFVNRIRGVCIIKLDVDGYEEDVIRGARVLNTLPDVRWLIETHSASLEHSCASYLQSAGFHTEIIPNAWWRCIVPELRPIHNRWLAAWK